MSTFVPPQAPDGLAEIIQHYGDPHVRIVGGEWRVDPEWEDANMRTVKHDLLPLGRLYVHRYVSMPLLHLLDRWKARIAAGDPYRVRTIGCFAPRAQRGSSGDILSTHTWGIAIDLNASTNALISPCAPGDPLRKTARDIPDAWIADARAEGWWWGGDFGRRFDPMHFQMATGY